MKENTFQILKSDDGCESDESSDSDDSLLQRCGSTKSLLMQEELDEQISDTLLQQSAQLCSDGCPSLTGYSPKDIFTHNFFMIYFLDQPVNMV